MKVRKEMIYVRPEVAVPSQEITETVAGLKAVQYSHSGIAGVLGLHCSRRFTFVPSFGQSD